MEYQVKMVYEQADVAALVRTLDYRRRPDRNTRRAMTIAGPPASSGAMTTAASRARNAATMTAAQYG